MPEKRCPIGSIHATKASRLLCVKKLTWRPASAWDQSLSLLEACGSAVRHFGHKEAARFQPLCCTAQGKPQDRGCVQGTGSSSPCRSVRAVRHPAESRWFLQTSERRAASPKPAPRVLDRRRPPRSPMIADRQASGLGRSRCPAPGPAGQGGGARSSRQALAVTEHGDGPKQGGSTSRSRRLRRWPAPLPARPSMQPS